MHYLQFSVLKYPAGVCCLINVGFKWSTQRVNCTSISVGLKNQQHASGRCKVYPGEQICYSLFGDTPRCPKPVAKLRPQREDTPQSGAYPPRRSSSSCRSALRRAAEPAGEHTQVFIIVGPFIAMQGEAETCKMLNSGPKEGEAKTLAWYPRPNQARW